MIGPGRNGLCVRGSPGRRGPWRQRNAHDPGGAASVGDAEYLLTRVLAYCLEYTEGIAFSKGLSDPDEPAIAVRDLTGLLQTWIDIGAPDASRLHRAAKAAPKVAVYAHRGLDQLVARLAGERIHRAAEIRLHAVEPELLSALVARLDRRMNFDLAVSDRTLYISLGDETLTGAIEDRRLDG